MEINPDSYQVYAPTKEEKRVSLLAKMKAKDFVLVMCILIFTLFVAGRLVILGTKEHISHIRPKLPTVERGSIYDRNGYLLAEELETFTIDLWLPDLQALRPSEDPETAAQRIKKTAESLAPILLWPAEEFHERITQTTGARNINLMRKTNIEIRDQILAVARDNDIRGLRILSDQSRIYPQGAVAANLIGYVNLDNQGGDGLEYSYERVLAPSGFDQFFRDRVTGSSIELTIDVPLQSILERKMIRAVADNKASSAIAIVADAKTADILAYASVPTYDPNYYNLASPDQRLNRPAVQTYEPGSVFKIFTIASVMDSGGVSPSDRFFCPGFYRIDPPNGEPIIIKCTGVHGEQNVTQVMSNSCNAGTAAIGMRISSREFYNRLRKFGFGTKTNIHVPGETSGILSEPKNWSIRSKPTIAIGQEVGVQALQIVQAATAITNSGVMLKPRIVRRVVDSSGKVTQEYPRQMVAEVLSPAVANSVLAMLEFGVDEGIARRMRVPGFRIGAKTGTSQTYDPRTGRYSTTNYIASTLAIFPIQDPQYIVYVSIYNPQGKSYFGANIVAPLIGEIAREMIPLYGLPSSGIFTLRARSQNPTPSPVNTEKTQVKYLPNFVGMTPNQLDKFFKVNKYLPYHIVGEGKVVLEQFPPAGTLVTPNITVRLEMKED
ncbi:MAG: penicillin-binding transpeptidase domain-containing protein [Spirochaetia bacterium]